MKHIKFRFATLGDTEVLLGIYCPYVENSTVTLEYVTPSVSEFADRIREYSSEFPYIVCELDGEIAGYAYAHKYKQRYGYRFCAELSVYLDTEKRGHGLGRRLYAALIELLREMGYRNLYGIVTDPNPASFALHKSFGFRETGREHLAGYKLGEWHDVVLFELLVGGEDLPPERPLTLGELEPAKVTGILERFS